MVDDALRTLREDVNHLFKMVNAGAIERTSLLERANQVRKDVDELEKSLKESYVRKDRYEIVEKLVFGQGVLILVAVFGAVWKFVFGK
jgi:hypothetical protein